MDGLLFIYLVAGLMIFGSWLHDIYRAKRDGAKRS